MSSLAPALGQIAVLVIALAVAVPVVGRYLAHVYTSPRHLRVERASYWLLPRLLEKRLELAPMAKVQPYIWFVGMLLF